MRFFRSTLHGVTSRGSSESTGSASTGKAIDELIAGEGEKPQRGQRFLRPEDMTDEDWQLARFGDAEGGSPPLFGSAPDANSFPTP